MTHIGTSPVSVALPVGVLAVSFAAIFIRLADAPALIIASYRMTIGGAVMGTAAGVAGWRSPAHVTLRRTVARGDLPLLAVAALSLAFHFWLWTASLERTSVTSAVVLVAVASRLFLGEQMQRKVLAGIAVAMAGGVVIAVGDASRERELLGDLLAFLGAVTIVGYLLAGRRLRSHVPLLPYTSLVYGGTAVLLLAGALVAGEPFTGYTLRTYGAILLLGLIPQVLGHSLLNWSLAHVTGTVVAVAVMAEPVIASLLAIPILEEVPNATSAVGGLLILAGIYVAMRPVNERH